MRDAVIVDAVRTPGRQAGRGAVAHARGDLSAHVLSALAERTQLDPGLVDDVIWGCVGTLGMQAGCIARSAVLAAGWPEHVPGVTVDRQCGSSQQAVHQAAAGVISGQYDVAIAGGVEMMSVVPLGSARGDGRFGEPHGPLVWERYGGVRFNQGMGAQLIANEYGLSRTDMDQHGLDSHARAAAAIDAGRFKDQIAPVAGHRRRRARAGLRHRRGRAARRQLEKLATLRPAFTEDGTITAGNSSQISDGAAALLITTSEFAEAQGWNPIARIHTAVVTGTDPVTMLKGPIPATAKALARPGSRSMTSVRSRSTRPSPRCAWPGCAKPAPTTSG